MASFRFKMVLSALLKVIVFANIVLNIQIVAHVYVIVVKDEAIFSPCEQDNVNYIDKYFDISNMNYMNLENGSVYFYGETVLTHYVGKEDNPASLQVFKKVRDNWVSTVYNMHRNDVCKHLYDESELWYPYVRDIPIEDRICPFPKDSKYYFNVVSDMELDLPDPRLAGEYKIQLMVTITELNEVFCANIMTEVYKK